MISTDRQKIRTQDIVEYQLPAWVREDFPLVTSFFKTYYTSQEAVGAPTDLIKNLTNYVSPQIIADGRESTELKKTIDSFDTTIVSNFNLANDIQGTLGFPDKWGLIQIEDEIILYESKTRNEFLNCVRGFSGTTSYKTPNEPDELTFNTSEATEHASGAKIINLSALLLAEFFTKLKYLYTPGFEERKLDDELNKRLFVSRAIDFYSSKGSQESFDILFGALYGEWVEVFKPRKHLFRPSDAKYRLTSDLVAEIVEIPDDASPYDVLNKTLYQPDHPEYGISGAASPITNVTKATYDGKDYYTISLDADYDKDIRLTGATFGEFSVHPLTKTTTSSAFGTSFIDVDSTIGFPDSGELFLNYNEQVSGTLSYERKTSTQFIGVTGITQEIDQYTDLRLNVTAFANTGIGSIHYRIGSVLRQDQIESPNWYFNDNDYGQIESLGIQTSGGKSEGWIYNHSIQIELESFDGTSATSYIEHDLTLEDKVCLVDPRGTMYIGSVNSISDAYTFSIAFDGGATPFIDPNFQYSICTEILKPTVSAKNVDSYQYLENLQSNVQNTYADFAGDVLVNSSSLPAYSNIPLDFYDRKVNLDGTYSGEVFTVPSSVADHGYFTGESVYYKTYFYEATDPSGNVINDDNGNPVMLESKLEGMSEGVYFIKRIDATSFKLASSPPNLFKEEYVSVSGTVEKNSLIYVDFNKKIIRNQNLLREVKDPVNKGDVFVTEPGATGILVNGVEILNYKSKDIINYGEVEEIVVTAPGRNYDIINPPILEITDQKGSDCNGLVAVAGSMLQLDLLENGFDYVKDPVITIKGGNGRGAVGDINTELIDYSVEFDPVTGINTVANTIGFSTFHKFREIEHVIYRNDDQDGVQGIVTDARYYAKPIDGVTVELYNNREDLRTGINTISLIGPGAGANHSLESVEKKKIVYSVGVGSFGYDYQNKERRVTEVGINTASHIISIKNHDYQDKDIILYSCTDTEIQGLSTATPYVVTKINDNDFKLSLQGIGTGAEYQNYFDKKYIELKSSGVGTHSFNYEPITVTVDGEIGIATFADNVGTDFTAKVQPVFRGEITSVFVENHGHQYGTEDIINYERQPTFETKSGEDAGLIAINNGGQIVEVLVTFPGSGYFAPPKLVVNGSGEYAELIPLLEDGKIVGAKIKNPGVGYFGNVTIDIIPAGENAEFFAEIQEWTINLFQKSLPVIGQDDGVLTPARNDEYGIEYTHLYAPRKLREVLLQKEPNGDIRYGSYDLVKTGNEETASRYHSPIIGWAYDGNPIYGPYGFNTPAGGSIRAMVSGYKRDNDIVNSVNRPVLESGSFVEDFVFTGEGDLDVHNGRYCITPEYPNGVYAYFATIDSGAAQSSGVFFNYKEPQFPYLIGHTFKSIPNEFNFDKSSNANDYDLNNSEWFRNTSPYKLNEEYAEYPGLFQPNKEVNSKLLVKRVSKGEIEGYTVELPGDNYKINDKVTFVSQDGARPASAKVSTILGREVSSISVASTSIPNIEIIPSRAKAEYLAFSPDPHDLLNKDKVFLSGFSTSVNFLQQYHNINVDPEFFILNSGLSSVTSTGIVTYMSVYGIFDDTIYTIRENDIVGIGTEQFKILNVDTLNSRFRVIREFNNTIGLNSFSPGFVVEEDPRKFKFASTVEDGVEFAYNREYYFDPAEAVAIGNTSGVGIGSTLSFSNPGAGITQKFVPTRTIYLPGHDIQTGEELIYNNNDGDSISISTDGVATNTLASPSTVYGVRISNDLLGLAPNPIGIGTTGNIVAISSEGTGLLYFTGIGTNVYHSLKTNRDVVSSILTKDVVTVQTSTDHGLLRDDEVEIDVNAGLTTTVSVIYNAYNNRIVFDPQTFTASGINTVTNAIGLPNHGFRGGEKVIYQVGVSTIATGPEENGIYYVNVYTKDAIRLSPTRLDSLAFDGETIGITSAMSGTISPINPPIAIYRNNVVRFDLSDQSLSFVIQTTRYPIFEFNLYSDQNFRNKYEMTETNPFFEVTKNGEIGVSSDAYLQLALNDEVEDILYYKLDQTYRSLNEDYKAAVFIDEEVINYNKVCAVESRYSGTHTVVGITTTNTFSYNLEGTPEISSYTSGVSYKTDSKTAKGGVSEILFTYNGSNYSQIVGVASITSKEGTGCEIVPQTTSIGSITTTRTINIGFDYPTDNTLRPVVNLPEIIELEQLNSIESIIVTNQGTNYNTAPDLIVIDGNTGEVVPGIELDYELGDIEVQVIKNTNSLYGVDPIIIPTNNSNGIGVTNVTFNQFTREVTASLTVGFSDASTFPFTVGSKILVENIAILGFGNTDSKGYNSEDYGYALFEVTASNPQLGGANGSVTYSMANVLDPGENPGVYDPLNSTGQIVPQSWFPTFQVELAPNDFFVDEDITSSTGCKGTVQSWIPATQLIKVSANCSYAVGDIITGSSSGAQGEIKSILNFDAEYKLGSSARVYKGWINEVGFLNLDTERIPDNYYYQKLSYSLKTKVNFDDWDDPVSALNHTAGFIKFADLQIESGGSDGNGGSGGNGNGDGDGDGGGPGPILPPPEIIPPDPDIIVDIIQDGISLNCYTQWDLVTENEYYIGNRKTSNEIYFRTKEIADFFESIGNRVLVIDDISGEFNSEPRVDKFSQVEKFDVTRRFTKVLTYVVDRADIYDRQLLFFSVLQDGTNAYTSHYGRLETKKELGSFDFQITDEEGIVTFYPVKFEVNDYVVSLLNMSIDSSILNAGSEQDIGDIVRVKSYQTRNITSNSNILSIPVNTRALKLLVQTHAPNEKKYESDELNIIHDGTEVYITDYGQLTTNQTLITRVINTAPDVGIGTFNAYVSGGNLNVEFYLDTLNFTTADVDILAFEMSDSGATEDSIYIGQNSTNVGALESFQTTIGAGSSAVGIASYSNVRDTPVERYSAAYYVATIKDTTNSEYLMSEILVLDDSQNSTSAWITEYGSVDTRSNPYVGLGTFGAVVDGDYTVLNFTPEPGIDVEARVLQMPIQIPDPFHDLGSNESVDLENGIISGDSGSYEGTFNDIKRSFGLTHKGYPIFQVQFDGSSTNDIDLVDNTILAPSHFFVDGEPVIYSYDINSASPLEIAPTNIPGFGVTSALPRGAELFAVAFNQQKLQLATSAENALASSPVVIDITNVGAGVSGDYHYITATKQNTKCLIAIDNMIQSPITPTKITTGLSTQVGLADEIISLTGVTSIYSADLIQIGNEIMRVNGVGVGGSDFNIEVNRRWMGTPLAAHNGGDVVTKIEGNYNIVENTLNFADPPIGPTPIGTPTNPPDDRDWTGLTTHSTFQGRSFIRSAIPGGTVEAYDTNYIFDDISDQFNGITSSFTLKSENQNITGFAENNGIVLINSIFQEPTEPQLTPRQYDLTELSGETDIQFYGNPIQQPNDIRTSDYPAGGTLSFVGSTNSYGYAPLVGAAATATVDSNGTITSINITNPGSGYRPGIQTNVFVGVTTDWPSQREVEIIGTAQISSGNHIFVSGVTNAITASAGGPFTAVTGTTFNPNTGELVLEIGAHTLTTSDTVTIADGGVSFTCDRDAHSTVTAYPRPTDPASGTALAVTNPTATTITVNVGTEPYAHGGNISGVAITNPGIGYTTPLYVVIDEPLPYYDVPLVYSSDSVPGFGTEGTVDIVVGRGTSVIDFKINKPGYDYGQEEILTVAIGGSTGIPLALESQNFEEFQIPVERTESDDFSGWHLGKLVDLDKIEQLFNGTRKTFPLRLLDEAVTIKSGEGSNIDIDAVVLVFINDILQRPSEAYTISNGSAITFSEAPNGPVEGEPGFTGDTCKILFYQGSGDVDVIRREVPCNIEIGDNLTIHRTKFYCPESITQDPRLVNDIISVDIVQTVPYQGVGIDGDPNCLRVVEWCKQTEDIFLDGKIESKSRCELEARVYPTARAISKVGTASTVIYVDSVKLGFDDVKEDKTPISERLKIKVVDQTQEPGVVERNNAQEYAGDFGRIVGYGLQEFGGVDEITVDLYIPEDSYMRDPVRLGAAATSICGLSTGDFFVISDSNVGFANTTNISVGINTGEIIGVGTQYIDNIYQVKDLAIVSSTIPGIGTTSVLRVGTNIKDEGGVTFSTVEVKFDDSGVGFGSGPMSSPLSAVGFVTGFYLGSYSWGKITLGERPDARDFTFDPTARMDAPIISRFRALKDNNYL